MNKNYVTIKAFQNKNKYLEGIVKISGKKAGSEIKGLCFLFLKEYNKKLNFYDNYMFFFGNYSNLLNNYHNKASIPKLNFEKFYFERDNLLIPLDLLVLNTARKILLKELIEYSKLSLIDFVDNLDKYKQEMNNEKPVLNGFLKFPAYIIDKSLNNGYYFSKSQSMKTMTEV